jgi:RNA polymerase sigma-70 factor (ECF subfamily)
MKQRIDSSVFSAFREGEHAAFSQVFSSYYQPLYYFTRKLIDSKEDAEEITLNSFLKLFQRHAAIDSIGAMNSFLYITARNNCFDYLRTNKVLRVKQSEFALKMQNETFLQFEYEIKDELVEMVRQAINDLPAECSKIFKMLYYEELSPSEVAGILQISVNTVYSQKSRALQLLRIALANHPLAVTFLLLTAVCLQNEHLTGYKILPD